MSLQNRRSIRSGFFLSLLLNILDFITNNWFVLFSISFRPLCNGAAFLIISVLLDILTNEKGMNSWIKIGNYSMKSRLILTRLHQCLHLFRPPRHRLKMKQNPAPILISCQSQKLRKTIRSIVINDFLLSLFRFSDHKIYYWVIQYS